MPSFLDNLNAMNDGVTRFVSTVQGAVNETKKLGKTLEDIAKSGEIFGGQQTVLVQGLNMVNKALLTGKEGIESQNEALAEQMRMLRLRYTQQVIEGSLSARDVEYYQKAYDALGNQLKTNSAILHVRETMGTRAIYLGSLLYTLYKGTFQTLRQMNEQLQAAAMTDSLRLKTNAAIFQATRSLGAPMTSSVEAAKELANFGMEFYDDMQENLETVTMMKEGLGVSAESAAELSAIVTRSLKVGFRDVADSIANTARDTGLSAQLAVKFATQIARAAMIFREGITKEMPKVIGYVTRLEGLLQEVGGVAGGITDLITRLTTVEGMVGAAMLGVQSPEFMATEAGAKQVMGGFADFAKQFLGDAGGWERTLRIQMLADMYGTTAQQVSAIVRAVDLDNKRLASMSGLQRAYQDQMANTGKGLERLKNSLMAMLQEGLAPVMWVLNKVVNVLADFVGWLQKHAKWLPVVVIGFTALGATIYVAYKAVMGLATACAWLAATARTAAKSVMAQGGAQQLDFLDQLGMGKKGGLGRTLGRLRGLGARGITVKVLNSFKSFGPWLMRLGPMMVAAVGKAFAAGTFVLSITTGILALLAGIGGAFIGYGLRKAFPGLDNYVQYLMGRRNFDQKTAFYTKTNNEWLRDYTAKMAGQGMSPEAITKVLRQRMAEQGWDFERQQTEIANLLRWSGEQIGDIRYQKFMQGGSLVPVDQAEQKRLLDDQKKMTEAAVGNAKVAQKMLDITKEETQRKRQEEDSRSMWYKLWMWGPAGWGQALGRKDYNKR